MKKLFSLILILLLIGGGYTLYQSYNSQKIVEGYINNISSFNKKQTEIMTDYEKNFVLEIDNEKALSFLKDTTLSEYNLHLDKVQKLQTATDELAKIHEIYANATKFQLSILLDYKNALENDNEEIFKKGKQKVEEMNELFSQHQIMLDKLADKHSIKILDE